MEVQNGSYQRFLGKLGTHTPLYDYTGIGGSEDFGLYYAVPYSDENDSVNGCIYISCRRSLEIRSIL
jgi:hypothetical protein